MGDARLIYDELTYGWFDHFLKGESKDATIDAKKIRFDYRTGTIVAEGNVVYATKNLRIIGDKIEADPRNDTIVATNVRFGRAPMYFTAETLKIVKGDKTMHGLRMWNSEPDQMGMHLKIAEAAYTTIASGFAASRHTWPASRSSISRITHRTATATSPTTFT